MTAQTFSSEDAVQTGHVGALRWLARLALALVVLVGGLWLVLFITKGRFLKPWFERTASAQLHRQVKVAGEFNLFFDPIDVSLRADGLSVANVAWAQHGNFLDAKHLALRLRTLPLLWGQHKISAADVDGARLALQWDAQHQRNTWTFDTEARGKPFRMPDIERGMITDTHIDYDDPRSQIDLAIDLHPVAAVHSHIDQDLGFSGMGTLRKQPLRFVGRIDRADQAVRAGASGIVAHVTGADTTVDATGQIPGISNIDQGRYHLAVRGGNMSNLLDFFGVVGVPTRRYHLVTELNRDNDAWVFTGLKGVFGDSDIAGSMTLTTPDDRLHLQADLHTASLDPIDAAPVFGYDPKRLDVMGTKGLVMQEHGHPRILPDTPLRSAELRQFDADVRYRVAAIAGKDFPVSRLDLTLHLDHGKMQIKPVSAVVATGRIDGAFALDMRGPEVVTDYEAHLHPTPMGKLLYRFGVQEAGTSGTVSGRLVLRGVGNSLRQSLAHADGRMVAIIPAGTMWARNIQLAELDIGTFVQRMFQKKLKDPVDINCGVVGFTVRQGISTADPILIDTRKNIITGSGDFSFRDESVDLAVKAKGKTFSLFSLQSPVGVGGYMAAPHLKVISPQLLGRAGTGVALGLVATPLAALVAFIDPGDGKAAACGPVLAGATAAAQRTRSGKPVTGLNQHKH